MAKARRLTSVLALTLLISLLGFALPPTAQADAGTVTLDGYGSTFAAPAMAFWTDAVGQDPYDLSVNYTSASSAQGRYEFANGTVDFAVSDTTYVSGTLGDVPPTFPFTYVPLVGAGVAFTYNIPGLTQTLQLTSYTACLLMTGQITNWDDPALHAGGANAGVTLPDLPVLPITESDPAGTNFAMEEYCIDEQPAVWAQYANNMEALGEPPSGVPISATTPGASWEAPGNGYDDQSTSVIALGVASNAGSIGFVQENYAVDAGFTGSNPAKAVAQVENASGDFTLPTPIDVTSALVYATQLSDGSAQLDFNGLGPNVYNPSTVSYLLTPTTGWSTAKGAVMSAFVDYALTLGQQIAPKIGYASLGQPLEQLGINEAASEVPGAGPMTAAEQAFYDCGDLSQADAAAGNTSPACESSPGTGLPETPYAFALPVLALGAFTAVFTLRRRRVA